MTNRKRAYRPVNTARIKFKAADSQLFVVTKRLLKRELKTKSMREISEMTGLPKRWLEKFHQCDVLESSVFRVEIIYNTLSKVKLEVPYV